MTLKVQKFTVADTPFERAPEQDGDIFLGNVVDQRHGGPITVGYGRYAPDQSMVATLTHVEATMVLEGRLSVTTDAGTATAGPGEVVYMSKGETVTLRSHEDGAVIVYVTYPHWQETM